MSLSSKRECLTRIYGRYQRAGRPHKSCILSEFCATREYHPQSGLRLLNRTWRTTPPRRSGPKVIYDPAEVMPVLKAVWLASDQRCAASCSRRALPEWLEFLTGSVTTSVVIVVCGLSLRILPTLVVGNELLILVSVGAVVGVWFFAHRHGQLRRLVEVAK